MVNLSRKKYVRLLVVALIICLISMIGASLVNTNFGHIKVQNFSIEDANGHKIALVMYKPENATAETPAPCVVTLHGSFDAKETQDYTCLELAKRGFVVLSMDCDGHGDSDNYKDNPMDAFFTVTANPGSAFEDISTSPGSGMCDVVNYAYNSLSFVDKDQIGITGHSLGGKMANACLGLHGIAAEDLDKVWIAYEPVWAIGVNGIPAPVEYAQEKHHVIRETLRELYGEAADVVPALYGGSVNLENATRLFVQPDIDGLYVGRVAWDAKRFAGLIADCLATGEK